MANIAIFQSEKWHQAYDILSQQQMMIEDYSSDHITGTIDMKEAGILFTSIPYDAGWHVYVDGNETEIFPLYQNTFVGIKLEKGFHNVRFVYHQIGLAAGVVLSIICIFIAIGIQMVCLRKEKTTDDSVVNNEED